MDGEGGVIDGRQAGGEAGPPAVMAILVPPAVLQEVQTVFQPPMVADAPQQIRRGHAVRIEAGDEISDVVRENLAGGSAHVAIHTQR